MELELLNNNNNRQSNEISVNLPVEVREMHFDTLGGLLRHEIEFLVLNLKQAALALDTKKLEQDALSAERHTPLLKLPSLTLKKSFGEDSLCDLRFLFISVMYINLDRFLIGLATSTNKYTILDVAYLKYKHRYEIEQRFGENCTFSQLCTIIAPDLENMLTDRSVLKITDNIWTYKNLIGYLGLRENNVAKEIYDGLVMFLIEHDEVIEKWGGFLSVHPSYVMEMPTLKFTQHYLGPATEFWHRSRNPFTSAGNRVISLESKINSGQNFDCYNWLLVRLWCLQITLKKFLLLNLVHHDLRSHRTNALLHRHVIKALFNCRLKCPRTRRTLRLHQYLDRRVQAQPGWHLNH